MGDLDDNPIQQQGWDMGWMEEYGVRESGWRRESLYLELLNDACEIVGGDILEMVGFRRAIWRKLQIKIVEFLRRC